MFELNQIQEEADFQAENILWFAFWLILGLFLICFLKIMITKLTGSKKESGLSALGFFYFGSGIFAVIFSLLMLRLDIGVIGIVLAIGALFLVSKLSKDAIWKDKLSHWAFNKQVSPNE